MPEALLVTLAVLATVAAIGLALSAFNRTGEIATPWTLFLAMATIDVFVPAAMQTVAPDTVLSASTVDTIGVALLVFVLSTVLFAVGYGVATGTAAAPRASSRPVVRFRICEAILCLALSVTIWRISHDSAGFSSFREFIDVALKARFTHAPSPTDITTRLLLQLSGTALTAAFICIGVLFMHRERAPVRYGVVWPAVGLVFSMSTLFRGTILGYLLGLLVVEVIRRREIAVGGEFEAFRRWSRVTLACGLLVGMTFFAYGSVRNWRTARAYGQQTSLAAGIVHEARQYSSGHGLRGLAAIIDQYPAHIPYLGGKTFRDMALLPVPRTIWKGKPEWYGIDDITRAMGWPPSTQSAVTMPGELWANFGPVGLVLMPLYGLGFGLLYRWRLGARIRYLYAFQVLPLMLTASWMAFTVVMNVLITVPVYAVLLWVVIGSDRDRPVLS
jgi:hypothetical protein